MRKFVLTAFAVLAAVSCVVASTHRRPAPPSLEARTPPTAEKPGAAVIASAPRWTDELGGDSPCRDCPRATASRVILVTIDGWHVKLTERMPVWDELVRDGSWTLKAEVPKGATTVISHAALYTGADPEVNGVTREPKKSEMTGGDPRVHGVKFRWRPLKVADTLFTATEAAGYDAVAVVQKGKLVGLLRPDGDETDIRAHGDKVLLETACAAVKDDRTRLIVLHFKMTDDAGHRHGWLSEEQYAEAEKISGHLRTIRACIAEAEKAGGVPTALVVTSDHGGTPNKGHGRDDDDNRLVPLAIVGPGVKAGHEIASPVRLVDVSATVLRLLGLPAEAIPTLSGAEISEILGSQ